MSNSTDSLGSAAIKALIQSTFDEQVFIYARISGITLLFYTTVLNISREIEHVWLRPFSLPKLLYILARYTLLIDMMLGLTINLLPKSFSLMSCNIIFYLSSVFMGTLAYISIQGSLIARAYALCKGNRVIAVASALCVLMGLIPNLIGTIIFSSCIASSSAAGGALAIYYLTLVLGFIRELKASYELFLLNLLACIGTILTDVLVLGVCLYNVWDTWKLKRDVNLQGSNNFISILLRQIVSRFFFTVFFGLMVTVLVTIIKNLPLLDSFASIEGSLSALLISDIILELRETNSEEIDRTLLPPVQSIPDMLQRIHQSFLMEMGNNGSA